MRKLKFLGMALVLAIVFALASPVLTAYAQDGGAKTDGSPSGSSNWFTRMFWPDDNSPPPKRATWGNRAPEKKPAPSVKRDKEKENEQTMLKREQTAYLRRLAVCDQLKDVALRTNDEQLRQKAEQLEAQALAVYNKRIAGLKASSAVNPSVEEPLDANPETGRSTQRSTGSTRASQITATLVGAEEEKP